MPRTRRHHRSPSMDIWDYIRASSLLLSRFLCLFLSLCVLLAFSLFLSSSAYLSFSISSLVNIYPRTQRPGFSYLRTNTHIQIYRRVLRCLPSYICLYLALPNAGPLRKLPSNASLPSNQISNPFGKLRLRRKTSRRCNHSTLPPRRNYFCRASDCRLKVQQSSALKNIRKTHGRN